SGRLAFVFVGEVFVAGGVDGADVGAAAGTVESVLAVGADPCADERTGSGAPLDDGERVELGSRCGGALAAGSQRIPATPMPATTSAVATPTATLRTRPRALPGRTAVRGTGA